MYSITEAFKKLKILDEELFDASDSDDLEELGELSKSDFQLADGAVDEVEIIDPDASDEDEILDDYTGRIIVQCPVCKSLFYKNEGDLEFDQDNDTLVNEGDECPYCLTSGGYEIVGKVCPFVPGNTEVKIDGEDVDIDYEDEDVEDIEDIEDEDVEEIDNDEMNESLCEGIAQSDGPGLFDDVSQFATIIDPETGEVSLARPEVAERIEDDMVFAESWSKSHSRRINEEFEEVSIKTGDQEMEMSTDPNTQEVSVKSRPRQALDNGDTMIGPMDDEEIEDTLDLGEEDFDEEDFGEEELPEEGPEFEGEGEFGDEDFNEEDEDIEEEADIEDFDEEGFDELGESYFRQVYDNVNRFATTGVYKEGSKLIIEGNLRFSSGNTHKTSFALGFDGMTESTKRARFIGENREITRGKKAFCLTGKIKNGKFMCESLRYHYKAKDSDGVSRRLYNTIYVK